MNPDAEQYKEWPELYAFLTAPDVRYKAQAALLWLLSLDPVKAANDAEAIARLLKARAAAILLKARTELGTPQS